MDEQNEKRERWLKRIQNCKRLYSFQKWTDKTEDENNIIKNLLKWMTDDITYLIKWNINLLLQLRAYGVAVKKYSGLSFFQQWKRMAHLVFKVRVDSNALRIHHLFEDERWANVHTYSFNRHTLVQNEFMGYPYDDELTCLRDKLKYYKYCRDHNIKTPEVYSVVKQCEIMFSNSAEGPLPLKNLFMKELDGSHGRGAKRFLYTGKKFKDRSGHEYEPDVLMSHLKEVSKKSVGVIVQEALENHDEWKKYTNGSLATCRIVTGRSPHSDEIIPFFAAFRMPFGDSDADNYSVGGIATQVDIKTGRMERAITPKPINGSFSFDKHPATGEQITGEKLYCWDELVQLAKATHKKFKSLSIGWDISLTTNGFYVVEGNSFWMSASIEGTSGVPIYKTKYPEWVEDWIEIRSKKKIESIQNFMR